MYNDLILIIISVFAVFGAYAVIREIVMLFVKNTDIVYAVRLRGDGDALRVEEALAKAEYLAQTDFETESRPVLLLDGGDAEDAERYGYEVYVKKG